MLLDRFSNCPSHCFTMIWLGCSPLMQLLVGVQFAASLWLSPSTASPQQPALVFRLWAGNSALGVQGVQTLLNVPAVTAAEATVYPCRVPVQTLWCGR